MWGIATDADVAKPQPAAKRPAPARKPGAAATGPRLARREAGLAMAPMAQGTEPADEALKRDRGRPKKSLTDVADQYWSAFGSAGDGSLFFGDRSETTLRLLSRWSAGTQKAPTEEAMLAKKKLQVMEHVVKAHRAWLSQAGKPLAAAQAFVQSWLSISTFASSAPSLPFVCPFLADVNFQAQAALVLEPGSTLVADLSRDVVARRFGLEDTSRAPCCLFVCLVCLSV